MQREKKPFQLTLQMTLQSPHPMFHEPQGTSKESDKRISFIFVGIVLWSFHFIDTLTSNHFQTPSKAPEISRYSRDMLKVSCLCSHQPFLWRKLYLARVLSFNLNTGGPMLLLSCCSAHASDTLCWGMSHAGELIKDLQLSLTWSWKLFHHEAKLWPHFPNRSHSKNFIRCFCPALQTSRCSLLTRCMLTHVIFFLAFHAGTWKMRGWCCWKWKAAVFPRSWRDAEDAECVGGDYWLPASHTTICKHFI